MSKMRRSVYNQSIAFRIFLALLLNELQFNSADRSTAFIGYAERTKDPCQDKRSDCVLRAVSNGCLYDSYELRQFCPKTCNVPQCSAGGRKSKFKGSALPSATQEYALAMRTLHKIHDNHWHTLLPHGIGAPIHLSSLGVGTHLGEPDAKTNEAIVNALIYSVTHGWNVIDTANYYRHGHSESSVGQALMILLGGNEQDSFLNERIPSVSRNRRYSHGQSISSPSPLYFITERSYRRDITRDMLFLSSKAGVMNQKLMTALLKSGSIQNSDIILSKFCIHPRCLEASLKLSLDRMNLETLDLLYLSIDAVEAHLQIIGYEDFMSKLMMAFEYLEEARDHGLIQWYGVSTWNCFRVQPASRLYLPLAAMVEIARMTAGIEHGFRFVQLPVSAAMTEAFTVRGWQGPNFNHHPEESNMTLLDLGRILKVSFFASSSLHKSELVQVTSGALDKVIPLLDFKFTAEKLIQFVRSVPGLMSVLVGQKAREHVENNIKLASKPCLTSDEFLDANSFISDQRIWR